MGNFFLTENVTVDLEAGIDNKGQFQDQCSEKKRMKMT